MKLRALGIAASAPEGPRRRGSAYRSSTTVVLSGLLLLVVLSLFASTPVAAQENDSEADLAPGGGRVIVVARPTWDTGWFQAEIVTQLLAELGYVIDGPTTYTNDDFYADVQTGEVDLWVNGWFPLHEQLLPSDPSAGALAVGVEVRGGALQGYLADLDSIEATGITDLADLADPEVAAVFDADRNGKADLIGCNLEWTCHGIVEHHLDAYGLSDTVEQISADYGPLMEAAVRRQADGAPVLYYTFTPNWTTGVLVPGRDVAWIPTPFPSLPVDIAAQEDETIIEGVDGCLTDPCAMGFPPNDIQAVANRELLDREPAIATLVEALTIPLADISAENARMFRGEDSAPDIAGHAEAWIDDNRDAVDEWLDAATEAHLAAGGELAPLPPSSDANRIVVGTIRVATRTAPPFVEYDGEDFTGFTISLLELVADEIGADLEIYGVTSNAKLIDDVARDQADLGASAIAITSQREERIDFSQPYFDSGLEIMVASESGGFLGGRPEAVARTVFSFDLLLLILGLIVVLFAAAHVVWLAERRTNPEFPRSYWAGIWEAVWWAAVTATTVGYGDKTPKGVVGRIFGLFWMFVGLFVLAYFTAGIATTLTLDELEGRITGPGDLRGHDVGVLADSLADEYLKAQGIPATEYLTAGEAYEALVDGSLDAIVHDAAILQHFITANTEGGVELTGLVFAERGLGFALGSDSELTEAINRGLIGVVESGGYGELYEQWFGADE